MNAFLFHSSLALLLVSCSAQKTTSIPIITVKPGSHHEVALTINAPDALSVSFDSLPTQVQKHNRSLAAARQLIAEARGKLLSSGLRGNDELEVEFEANPDFQDFMLTVGVTRKFPRTNKLLIEKRISGILVQAALAEVRDAKRIILGRARAVFIEALSLREEKKLLLAQEANARQLSEFIKESSVRGEASPLEAGTAIIEATRIGNLSKQIDIKEQLVLARLKSLLGMTPSSTLTLLGDLPSPSMPTRNVSTYQRPDLQAARLRAQSAQTSAALTQARDISDLEAGVFAGLGREEDAPNGTESEQIIGIRFKIPLGPNPATPGKLASARARQTRLSLGADALRQKINAESHSAYAEMEQWQQLATQINTELFPLATKQITATNTAYKRGEIQLQDVLRAQEQHLNLKTTHLQAVRDFHLARVKYLTATAQ